MPPAVNKKSKQYSSKFLANTDIPHKADEFASVKHEKELKIIDFVEVQNCIPENCVPENEIEFGTEHESDFDGKFEIISESKIYVKYIELDSQEVENMTIIDDKTHLLKLNPKRGGRKDKANYNTILKNKLPAGIVIIDSWKGSGKINKVNFLKCDHGKRHSINYNTLEHKIGMPLKFKITLSCRACAGLVLRHPSPEVEKLSEPQQLSSSINNNFDLQNGFESVDSCDNNKIIDNIFTHIICEFNNKLNKLKAKCLASSDPVETLIENQEAIALEAKECIMNVIEDLKPEENTMIIKDAPAPVSKTKTFTRQFQNVGEEEPRILKRPKRSSKTLNVAENQANDLKKQKLQ